MSAAGSGDPRRQRPCLFFLACVASRRACSCPAVPGGGSSAESDCAPRAGAAVCVCVSVRVNLGGVEVVSEPVRKNDSGVHHGVLPERGSQGSPADQRRDRAAAAPGQAGRSPGAEATAAG